MTRPNQSPHDWTPLWQYKGTVQSARREAWKQAQITDCYHCLNFSWLVHYPKSWSAAPAPALRQLLQWSSQDYQYALTGLLGLSQHFTFWDYQWLFGALVFAFLGSDSFFGLCCLVCYLVFPFSSGYIAASIVLSTPMISVCAISKSPWHFSNGPIQCHWSTASAGSQSLIQLDLGIDWFVWIAVEFYMLLQLLLISSNVYLAQSPSVQGDVGSHSVISFFSLFHSSAHCRTLCEARTWSTFTFFSTYFLFMWQLRNCDFCPVMWRIAIPCTYVGFSLICQWKVNK